MKKSTRGIEFLPREVIVEILSRLPITSSLQLKLVCKSWHNLLQDPYFIFTHFSRTGSLDPCLIFHSDSPIPNQLYSLQLSDLCDPSPTVNKILVPRSPEYKIVGSCRGLLCLFDWSTRKKLYIYNPFTRNCIKLPESPELHHQIIVCGLGFNSQTNEYKVVKVVYWKTPLQIPKRKPLPVGVIKTNVKVQILTLGRDITWRNLNPEKLSFDQLYQSTPQVLVNGRIHWRTWPQRCRTGSSIVSFDLEKEQFQVVAKPDGGHLDTPSFDLIEIGGCLSAVVQAMDWPIEIWVMKEYGVKESWVKEYSIVEYVPRSLKKEDWKSPKQFFYNSSPSYYNFKWFGKRTVRVLGILRTGEVLLQHGCRGLFSYDRRGDTFKDLCILGLPDWLDVIILHGSLNWIDTFLHVNANP